MLGNEQNMAKVNELMKNAKTEELADEVNLGGDAQNRVYIDYTSGFGTPYKGWIHFKRPTAFDYMRMGGIKSEILRTAGVQDLSLVDNSVKFMAHVMGTLKVVVAKAPMWFIDIDAIEDTDLIYHVYGRYEVWEDSFRPRIEDPSSGDSEASE